MGIQVLVSEVTPALLTSGSGLVKDGSTARRLLWLTVQMVASLQAVAPSAPIRPTPDREPPSALIKVSLVAAELS